MRNKVVSQLQEKLRGRLSVGDEVESVPGAGHKVKGTICRVEGGFYYINPTGRLAFTGPFRFTRKELRKAE